MGLTIHYSLHSATRSTNRARQIVESLRQRALDLPFSQVSDLIELPGEQCNYDIYNQDDPRRWLVIQAGQHVKRPGNDAVSYHVAPEHIICFETLPGDGCEPANFGLCRYPAFMKVDDPCLKHRRVRTRLSRWSWSSFCKTQYASSPECGGTENFLRCHLAVLRVLDHAQSIGILDEVEDEGEFWTSRDVKLLTQQVGEWNAFIAGFVGELKDLLGDDCESPITSFSNFEHLEARGRGS